MDEKEKRGFSSSRIVEKDSSMTPLLQDKSLMYGREGEKSI